MKSDSKKVPKGEKIGTFGMPRRLTAPDRGYQADLPGFAFGTGGDLPVSLNPGKKKAISLFLLIGKSSIAVAFDLDLARRVLEAQQQPAQPWKPTGELANALEGLPANLTFLSVSDPTLCGLPDWIAGLPGTIRFIMRSIDLDDDLAEKPFRALLDAIGVPHPGRSNYRVDRAKTPRVEDLRRYVFASVLASAVDDRGYRIIHRQPVPFAGLASEIAIHQRRSMTWKGFRRSPSMAYLLSVGSPQRRF